MGEVDIREDLIRAVDLAIAGEWDAAHKIVQHHETAPLACWLHAVLHKIEPDEANARYWYAARAGATMPTLAMPGPSWRPSEAS